ncbi:184_t:CDS:1, partial [Paraglomus occultum]
VDENIDTDEHAGRADEDVDDSESACDNHGDLDEEESVPLLDSER